MKRIIILSLALLGVTAAISIVLWANGFPPAGYADSQTRQIITFPGFWALAGGALFWLTLLLKRNVAEVSGRYRAVIYLNIMFGPLTALFAQTLMSLRAYDLIDAGISDLPAFFFIIGIHIFIGNYVATTRHNSVGGIRSPWTRADASVWTRTQRFFGRNVVLGALATIPFAVFWNADLATWIAIGTFFANVALAYLFSYLIRSGKAQTHSLSDV